MLPYSQNDLHQRNKIIQTHIIFGEFLTEHIMNTLVYLFDNTYYNNMIDNNHKIVKYIEDERQTKGLSNNNVTIISEVYGYNVNNSTLYLGIKKNNSDFIHLTIHLTSKSLNPKNNGMIHIFKDIYKRLNPTISKRESYALISVELVNKSLYFSIDYGYDTPNNLPNTITYDHEIQKEMDVIITVLNRMFDENNSYYYVGNTDTVYPLHNTTNKMLHNINSHTKTYSRKTKGNRSFPKNSLEPAIVINRVYKNKSKSTNRRATRKSSKIHK